MCEIDERVCEVSKKYFANSMATAFNDPRLQLHYMDAAVYMKAHKAEFDVIIVDSSDPVGPAETLYTSDFYTDMNNALRGNGIVCTQGECMWLHLDLIARVMRDAKGLYPTVDYAYTCIPTYPSGQIGFVLASRNPDRTFRRRRVAVACLIVCFDRVSKSSSGHRPPALSIDGRLACIVGRHTRRFALAGLSLRRSRPVPADMAASLRYYNTHMHAAAFKLPNFAEDSLASVRPHSTEGDSFSRKEAAVISGATAVAVAAVGLGAFLLSRVLRR